MISSPSKIYGPLWKKRTEPENVMAVLETNKPSGKQHQNYNNPPRKNYYPMSETKEKTCQMCGDPVDTVFQSLQDLCRSCHGF